MPKKKETIRTQERHSGPRSQATGHQRVSPSRKSRKSLSFEVQGSSGEFGLRAGGRRLSWRTTAKSIINRSLRPFGVELHALPSATQVDDFKRLTRRTVKEYLALCDPKILQIASGPSYAAQCYRNWLNSDVGNPQCCEGGLYSIYMDLNHYFPLPTGSFDYIFSQQGIEHFTYNRGVQILRECCRVLKPGGRVRIETPNIAYFIDNYRTNDKPVAEAVHEFAREFDAPPTHLTMLNAIVRHWGHSYLYDVETLANLCRECGFADVREVKMGRTDIVAFQAAIAFNPGSCPDPWFIECSFALEMERPVSRDGGPRAGTDMLTR